MYKTAVIWGVVGGLFGPVGLRIAAGSPPKRIGIAWKHKITGRIWIGFWVRDMPASAINEFGAIFPKTTQVVVVIASIDRVGLVRIGAVGGVRVIQKPSHAKAFVVYNAISVTNAIERFVFPDTKGVVEAVVVLIRPFKKVDPDRRRRVAITFKPGVVSVKIIAVVVVT